MKIIVIDNYDSFTYNLVHLVRSLGAEVSVVRNDALELPELEAYDKIILSPGPGVPAEAGLLLEIIHTYAARKPILGVCLGHQAIAEAFGGQLINLREVHHGIASLCMATTRDYLFSAIAQPFTVGRYHSWVVADEGFPTMLEVTARSRDGEIMALRHRAWDVRGIQFHPESVLTPEGHTMLENWLNH